MSELAREFEAALVVGEEKAVAETRRYPSEPQENLLYFMEKNAPLLEPWQREILRIVRKVSQYFYPQKQTQVMNEGWATFWHYTLMNDLYDEGLVTEGFMMEFLQSHTGVIYQPGFETNLYDDRKAYRVGDIITIVLVERTQATKSNSADTNRSGSIGLNPPTTGLRA